MSGSSIYWTWPRFGPIPDGRPVTIPPPVGERSFRSPFGIDPDLFHFALRPEVPIIFASVYIVTVLLANSYNAKRKAQNNGVPKPWFIARQSIYQYFVVAHNAALIVYSGATFLAMLRAAFQTWPGFSNGNGAAGLADAFCKMNGPRGLGDAVSYNTTINIWEAKNYLINLTDGNPDPTDVGRLWNEGLAFWGWWFYMSKFYEVVDTLIILAKGKRSPTLQTYHHSGAMLCMWAGIRYMSPPIWMFVFVNSFIHTLMYTYFTLSALDIRVPVALKRTLTTMQIIQLIWGSLYAGAHLFLQYDSPVTSSHTITTLAKAAVSSVASAAAVATSSISEFLESPSIPTSLPTPSGDMIALAKKLLLRAVGEEGIAERVTNKYGQAIAAPAIIEKIEEIKEQMVPHFETKWSTDLTRADCLDTSGQAFAIYLNLLYLAPLTFLFLRFFVKAYTDRGKPRTASEAAKRAVKAGKEAGEKTEQKVEAVGKKAEKKVLEAENTDLQEQLRKDVQSVKQGTFKAERQVKSVAEKVKTEGQKAATDAGEKIAQAADAVQQKTQALAQDGASAAKKAEADLRAQAETIKQKTLPSSETKDVPHSDKPVAETESTATAEKAEPAAATASSVEEEEDKENLPPSSELPAATQDSILAATQDIRPGEVAEEEGSLLAESQIDTDAMGKSGALVDYVAEKADELADEAKEAVEETRKTDDAE